MSYVRTTIECYCCDDTISVVDATAINGRPYCEDCVADIDDASKTPCQCCSDYFDPAYVTPHRGHLYCEACYQDMQAMCVECGCQVYLEDTHDYDMVDGSHYCRDCYDDLFVPCTECGEIVDRGECRETPSCNWGDQDYFCDDCWDEYVCECDNCGEIAWIDDCVLTQRAYGTRGARYECQNCRRRVSDYWCPADFHPTANTFDRVGSERCFGIELEYNRTPGANADVAELEWFGRKGEHCGCEMYSSILQGDTGLSAAASLADYANDNDWRNDSHCGYHLHLDMRTETFDTMRSLAYAYRKTYPVWKRFVSEWRGNNCDYCHAPGYTAATIRALSPAAFERWAYNSQRFLFVNWSAYGDHSTVEVRLHSGTQDSQEITNWVIAHTRFADWGLRQTLDEIDATFNGVINHDFQALCRIWGDTSLKTFYRDKANEHGQPVDGRDVPREAVAV